MDVKALKSEMVKNGYTQQTLAKELGISPRTLYNKFKSGDFGTKEIEIMIPLLNLKDPMSIFFTNQVT